MNSNYIVKLLYMKIRSQLFAKKRNMWSTFEFSVRLVTVERLNTIESLMNIVKIKIDNVDYLMLTKI